MMTYENLKCAPCSQVPASSNEACYYNNTYYIRQTFRIQRLCIVQISFDLIMKDNQITAIPQLHRNQCYF